MSWQSSVEPLNKETLQCTQKIPLHTYIHLLAKKKFLLKAKACNCNVKPNSMTKGEKGSFKAITWERGSLLLRFFWYSTIHPYLPHIWQKHKKEPQKSFNLKNRMQFDLSKMLENLGLNSVTLYIKCSLETFFLKNQNFCFIGLLTSS